MPRNKGNAQGLDLSIVVPLFNESGTFDELHRRLTAVLLVLGLDSEIIYVDDGSTDGTGEALAALAQRDARVRVINLARNYGQTAALAAGFDAAAGDAWRTCLAPATATPCPASNGAIGTPCSVRAALMVCLSLCGIPLPER